MLQKLVFLIHTLFKGILSRVLLIQELTFALEKSCI